LCLGGMAAPVNEGGKWLERIAQKTNIPPWAHKLYPGFLVALSIVMLVVSARFLAANTAFLQAYQLAKDKKTLTEIMEKLDIALNYRTNHPDYTLFKVEVLNQAYAQTKDEKYFEQAVAAIDELRKAEPYNRLAFEQKFYQMLTKDKLAEALQLVDENIANFAWDINMSEKQISLNFDLGNRARMEQNYETMDRYWNTAFEIYNDIQRKEQQLSLLPKEQLQGRPFHLTPISALVLGQIEYIRGRYASAEKLLGGAVSDQLGDPTNREIARWYLASLQKQGKNDTDLYDKLISADAAEAQQITALLNANFLPDQTR